MRQIKIGKVCLTDGGTWNSTTGYSDLVYVRHNGDGWWSKKANINSEPSSSNPNWIQATNVQEFIASLQTATTNANQINNICQAAEEIRKTSETARIANENERKENETTRKQNESNRVATENIRVSAESTRQANETARINGESQRNSRYETAEASRNTTFNASEASRTSTFNANEATRQSNETTRQSNEATRQSTFEVAMASVETATGLANTAASEADTKADYAKEQGDYAKEEGDKASVLNDTVSEHTTKLSELDTEIGSLSAKVQKLTELYGDSVEGFIRKSGVSDPTFNYRNYKHSVGMESVFDVFYPCLVGNKTTGNVGKILHILQKLDWSKDVEGNDVAIDGSMGEVLICNIKPYYHITGKVNVGGINYDVFLRSYEPFEWEGHAAELQPCYGQSPHYCVAHKDDDNVTRMHSVYNPNWQGSWREPVGLTGKYIYTTDNDGNIVKTYDADTMILGNNGNGYGSTDIALYNGEQYAMNNNDDTTKTYPYYNATARGCELFFGAMVAEGGTFDSHKPTLMGSGFSTNDGATSSARYDESDTYATNGCRWIGSDGSTMRYATLCHVNANTTTSFGMNIGSKAQMLNDWRSPWKVMEQQRVLCHANSHNIAELTWFTFEGNLYKWRHVEGYAGLSEGEMTAVVWKLLSSKLGTGTIDPKGGASVEGNDIDFLVSSAIYRGQITDASPSRWMSGLIFAQYSDGSYKAYIERDQTKLIKSENGYKNESDTFNFETLYMHVGDTYVKGEGYRKDYANEAIMLPNTNSNKSGAGLHTHICAYNYFTASAPASGRKSVRGFRFGGSAGSSSLSPLSVGANTEPSVASSGFGFGICAMVEAEVVASES